MPKPAFIHTLRYRLMVTFVMVSGLILVAFAAAGLWIIERQLIGTVDAQLIGRARQLVAAIVQSPTPLSPDALADVLESEERLIYFNAYFIQIRDASGDLIRRSGTLRGKGLPFPAPPPSLEPGQERLMSVEHADVGPGGDTIPLRMLVAHHQSPGVAPFYLQVAADLSQVRATNRFIQRLVWSGLAAALLTAAVASWFAAGQATRRIARVARIVRGLGPDALGNHDLPAGDDKDEVGRLIRDLSHMLDRLDAGFSAQHHFVQDISHELKTPLSVLLGQAQIIQMGDPDPEIARAFASSVADEARHLGELVESLLALARLSAEHGPGAGVGAGEPIDLNDTVLDAVHACRPLAEGRGVSMAVQLAGETHGEAGGEPGDQASGEAAAQREPEPAPTCRGDAALIVAMVGNLLRNAIQFSPAGRPVEVSVEAQRDHLLIRVRDHGPGIAPDLIGRIFDRRVQGPPIHGVKRGSGLGLAIARTIAERHGGTLTAENHPDTGCQFTITLPAA